MSNKFVLISLVATIFLSSSAFAKQPHPDDTDPVTGLCSTLGDGGDNPYDIWVHWDDNLALDGSEKYGGDMEIDTEVTYICSDGSEGTLNLSLEIELEQDENSVLPYHCDGVSCSAHSFYDSGENSWGTSFNEMVESSAIAACTDIGLESHSSSKHRISFGVKEMNPGPGKSQDKVKAKIVIYDDEVDPTNECAVEPTP